MNLRPPSLAVRPSLRRGALAFLALAGMLATAAPSDVLAAAPAAVFSAAAPAAVDSASARSAAAPRAPSAAAPAQAGGVTYRLADTWEKRPWSLEAGRFGETADVSSAPDGTLFVLDSRHKVVHVLAPDGAPIRVFSVAKGSVSTPRRLDAGWDGTVYVLSDGPRLPDGYTGGIDQFTAEGARSWPDGSSLLSVPLSALTPNAFRDLAIHPDGRIFLSRAGPANPYVLFPGPTATPMPPEAPPLNAIDVLDADGNFQQRFGMEHLCMPDSLDVDAGGTTYVVSLCPSPFGGGGPGPDPTPRPSFSARPAQQGEAANEGVLVFGPDFQLARKERFSNADDIAVGPAGAFVSRGVEIFALGQREPIYGGPAGGFYAAFFGEIVFHLDVPAAGGLVASMNHCFFQGVLRFARPDQAPAVPALSGALDQPELEGPIYPLRLDAGQEVAVLQGRFAILGTRPNQQYMLIPYYGENQVVQRWRPDGTLPGQLGVCGQTEVDEVRDVSVDGIDIYTIDQSLLSLRPDDAFPAWTYWPGLTDAPDVASRLQAVSAGAGRVAVLDTGANRVLVLDSAMNELGRWSMGDAVPGDLALGADRVFLAESGRGRVLVRGLDGRNLGEWPLHEGALGIAVGPEGDVFTLGRGGWAYRYRPDGTLVAAWPMPDRALQALDLGVGDDGRVYVNFLDPVVTGQDAVGRGQDFIELRQAGVWVFEATVAPPPPPPPPASACVAAPHKMAAPRRIPLGDLVGVRLTVGGRCPGRVERTQVAMVFDTSRSMNFDNVLEGALDGGLAVLDALDPNLSQVALVTFDESAALKQPLTNDLALLRRQVAGLTAWGDTKMSTGLDAARLELTGARRDPTARQVVILFTDGMPKDDPLPAAADLAAAGIEVYVLVYNTWEFMATDLMILQVLAGDPRRVMVQPRAGAIAAAVRDLTGYQPTLGLFETITIRDVIPGNMRYVPGSALPPATLEGGNTLVWTFTAVPADETLLMGYRLEPLEVGTWPTNVEATAQYRDVLGFDGNLIFPVPEVTVYTVDRRFSIYLPYLSRGQCVKPERPLDVVLALDTSSSMNDPVPEGGTKLEAAVTAARHFVNLLRLPTDRAALVTFDRAAREEVGLSGDAGALAAVLARLTTAQGTRIDLGLIAAGATLAAGGRLEARQVIVLLTDGIQSQGTPADVLAAAAAVKAGGALVYTIGLGTDVEPELLRQVATTPDRYFESPSTADLAAIYFQISERLACE